MSALLGFFVNRFDPPRHAGRQDLELLLTIFEGREERLPQEREVRAEPAPG